MTDPTNQNTTSVYTVDLASDSCQSTSVALSRNIATLDDKPCNELEPLWDSVHPDALDALVNHAEHMADGGYVAFSYEGYDIEIVDGHEMRISPADEAGWSNVARRS